MKCYFSNLWKSCEECYCKNPQFFLPYNLIVALGLLIACYCENTYKHGSSPTSFYLPMLSLFHIPFGGFIHMLLLRPIYDALCFIKKSIKKMRKFNDKQRDTINNIKL